MTLGHLGGDPLEQTVAAALDRLAAGTPTTTVGSSARVFTQIGSETASGSSLSSN